MPDHSHQTVSASQAAALFNQSPYLTRWMLWHHFKNGMPIEPTGMKPLDRIDVGTRLEPAILGMIAESLRLNIASNRDYIRHKTIRLGATRDGDIFDPSLGFGAVEAKNLDYLRWRDAWTEEDAAPHVEIQLQCQMMVGDGHHPYKWGVIGALVGGNEIMLYRRDPNEAAQDMIEDAVGQFFADLEDNREPDPLGSPIEIDGIRWLYPETAPGKVATWGDPEGFEAVEQYEEARAARLAAEKLEKALLVKIQGKATDAAILNVPGYEVSFKRTTVEPSYAPLPDAMVACARALREHPNLEQQALALAEMVMSSRGVQSRAGFTKVTMKTRRVDL